MTVRLAATEYGALGKEGAPPLAILHGLFGSGRNWASIAQRLAAHRPVIAFDLRNHGGSAGRVYGPTCANCWLLILKIECDNLFAAVM